MPDLPRNSHEQSTQPAEPQLSDKTPMHYKPPTDSFQVVTGGQLLKRPFSSPNIQSINSHQQTPSPQPSDKLKRLASGVWDESSSPKKVFGIPGLQETFSTSRGAYDSPRHANNSATQSARSPAAKRGVRLNTGAHGRTASMPLHSQVQETLRPPSADFNFRDPKFHTELERVLPNGDEVRPLIAKQPPSQEITQQQLAQEITAIYKALVQIEQKCVSLVGNEFAALRDVAPNAPVKKEKDHWQALIALHRTLLHEHHDFFLASQHPSSGPALREIATKYSMPARMWKHGIHNFLELLRRHLPLSMEFMLAFIYLAYQMMALLFETVPNYKDTWIECLGDLARYRMAIEEEDLRDREIWTGVAKMWYCKAVDRSPKIGRLQHHLAILARTNAVEQLSLYARSLAAKQPFSSTRGSIMTLLEPMLARQESARQLSVDTWFVKVQGLIFTNGPEEHFQTALNNFTALLKSSLEHTSSRWGDQGSYIAISNIVSCIGWGLKSELHDQLLKNLISNQDPATGDVAQTAFKAEDASEISLQRADKVFNRTLELVLAHPEDPNIFSFVFLTLQYVLAVSHTPSGHCRFTSSRIWQMLAILLNKLVTANPDLLNKNPFEIKDDSDLPDSAPLAEEFLSNGQIWAGGRTPQLWLARAAEEEDHLKVDKEEALLRRKHRLIWMSKELLEGVPDDAMWLRFTDHTQQFTAGAVTSPAVAPEPTLTISQSMEIRVKPMSFQEPRIASQYEPA